MSSTGVEIERKYDVDEGARMPDLTGLPRVVAADEPNGFDLDATYFDTPELTLADRHVAVRRRVGGHDAGWHIKWPPQAEGRTEQQFPLGGEEVPAEVRAALAELVGDAELVPIARIRNHRVATVLRDAAGGALVELADDHVAATDLLHGVERRWQEWEAELLDAGSAGTAADRAALLDAIEERLVAAGARPASSGSKLARALGVSGR
ncbi:CYTH domain-containing protein [Gryllotalpicola ginsengisoli]|uniref:CYTH domain-containing protein n=1 Tax=Gryllotalpicola ginsengisoli TaxID=444608 RepID=UPI0003B346AB|nr:CYTH domain-containing protein [Gryllotalpicola ginsengisoli]